MCIRLISARFCYGRGSNQISYAYRSVHMASADALGDDWWLEPEEREQRKRIRDKEDFQRKKNKRRKITDVLSTAQPESQTILHSPSRQYTELLTALQPQLDKLTAVEAQEIQLKKKNFVHCKVKNEVGVVIPFDIYLQTVCPHWNEWIKDGLSEQVHGSPHIIVISSSAKRAIELKIQASNFYKGEVAKLFAKNIKIEDQVTHLTSHVTHIAVATPNRLQKLLSNKALVLSQLKLVILDWYWRNKKLKRLTDIPEIWRDFSILYINHLNELVTNGQVKVGLY